MSRHISRDRVPEDESVFDLYLDEEEFQPRPVRREPELPRCRNCVDRRLIPDGKNGWVHEDNYLYSCETDPRARKSSTVFAVPVMS